jgi:hypothetical protein
MNVFKYLEQFKRMLSVTKQSTGDFTEQEKDLAAVFENAIDTGKLFVLDPEEVSKLKPIPYPIKFQNLPFNDVVVLNGYHFYYFYQSKPGEKIAVFIALVESTVDCFTPIAIRGELYDNKGEMFYRAYEYDDAQNFWQADHFELDIIKGFLSDSRYLIATINSPSDAVKIESINTPARKCQPGEARFRSRFSIVSVPSKSGSKSEPKHTGRTVALHDRRGHYRKLKTKSVWVRACKVGSIKNGVVVQQYKIGGNR